MKIKYLIVGLVFTHSISLAQDKVSDLIKSSVVPAKSINEEFTEEFKSLLKTELRDVRVVSLGENTHEDGSTFAYKTKLIKFLHEELGFNVLAFEFGFFGNWKTGERLKNGEDVQSATMYSGWSKHREAYPIYQYMADSYKTENPLYYAGFDSEKVPDGIPNIVGLISEVNDLLKFNMTEENLMAVDSLIKAVYGGIGNSIKQKISHNTRNEAKRILNDLAQSFKTKEMTLVTTLGHEKYMVYDLALKSISLDERNKFSGAFSNIVRDKDMATRIKWLTDILYKGEKIILWGASGHFMKNAIGLNRTLPPDAWGYYGYYQMGDYLNEYYKEKFYSIVFTAGSGKTGTIFPEDHKYKKYEEVSDLGPFKTDSFEELSLRTNRNTLFCSLRSPSEDSWLSQKFTAYPYGYNEDFAKWKDIVDAIFFIKEMKPTYHKQY